jgi:flagellar M-ring protein FliF
VEAGKEKSLGQVLGQMEDFVRGLTLGQRGLLAFGALAVGLTLWFFVRMIGEPKFTTLYSGLRAEEAQTLAARLAAKNISYQLTSDGGGLQVPADKLDAARLETAAQGLPRSARLGFELFDTPNWAGSEFTEKVNFQRALEGELERTLQTLSDVEAVRVHLVLPRESLFTEQEREAKAAVIVKTRGGRLSEEAQAAIPQLVASAVDKLRPENVTVIDADSNTPFVKSRTPGVSAAAYQLDQEMATTVVRTLEPVLGADHVRASVHVEYDASSSDNTEELYDPTATATLTSTKSEELAGGTQPGGIPGTASNIPGSTATATTAVATQAEQQSSRSESFTYAVSKTVRHTLQPAGRLKRITAAVVVDDAVEWKTENGQNSATRHKRTPEEMKEIEQLAQAALGIDTSRGDLLAVENISFREAPAEKIVPPTRVEKVERVLTNWSGALRYLGITLLFLAVYALVLRPVKKHALAAFQQLPGRLASAAAPAVAAGAVEGLGAGGGNDDARRAAQLKRQLTEKIKAEPASAGRLVQNWLQDGGTR